MRILAAAVFVIVASAAMADDLDVAHTDALAARNSYWNCLAQEYSKDSNRNLSAQDFTLLVAGACPSERQNLRVLLLEYLTMQFRDVDPDAHMTTANNAIALAQKDVATAFTKHKATAK